MPQTKAVSITSAKITVPSQCTIETNASGRGFRAVRQNSTQYRLYFTKKTSFPLVLKVTDLFGSSINLYVKDPSQIQDMIVKSGFVKNPSANPIEIYSIPKLCPRAHLIQEGGRKSLVYDASLDILNKKPGVHLTDPDYKSLQTQKRILENFDKKNVLKISRVKLSYDFEDNTILDYQGPHPLTKKEQLIYEGDGGFYANLHYAIVPYNSKYLNLGRQELLNLSQGKLYYIDRLDLQPNLRAHSFIPGPYQSNQDLYTLCEWGDTAFQAKEQEMSYKDFKVWDWDITDVDKNPINKVIMVVWEGDEEDWLISDGLLDPFYLTDDLIGVFVIDRKKTLKPMVLKNKQGNFEVEVVTKE